MIVSCKYIMCIDIFTPLHSRILLHPGHPSSLSSNITFAHIISVYVYVRERGREMDKGEGERARAQYHCMNTKVRRQLAGSSSLLQL